MDKTDITAYNIEFCGYYFEVEKISETQCPNYSKRYPCCEVVNVLRYSKVKFYKDNEVSFEWENKNKNDIQIIVFKEELKPNNMSTSATLYINSGEQVDNTEFKEFVRSLRS